MTLLRNDPLTQLAFSIFENKGVFALLIGSGLSRSAEIPTGWEITLDLVRRIALAQGVKEQADWAKWYRDTTGTDPNYSVLMEDIAISPDERRSILHSYIEPDEEQREKGQKLPTSAHHAIAGLVRTGYIRVIVTTNFDRLMENALRECGVEPTVVSSVDSLLGAEPLTHSQCFLFKLHGDYKDARILNTDSELASYPSEYNRLLDRIFDEHGLIICGWSGEWDHALRAAFLRAPNRRYPVFWATRGELGEGAQRLAAHRQAKVFPIPGADQFFSSLQQRVETLEQTQRQNPLSVELMVSSAKRYLMKPEYRIHLDELFSEVMARLLEQLDAANLAPLGQSGPEMFRVRVQLYEALTEPLARMAGVLGRWGDRNQLPLVLDVISAILSDAEKIGHGIVNWLNLRSYPAVLVFYAYGLGLTRTHKWDVLHELLNSPILRDYQSPKRIVTTLFLNSWRGAEPSLWKQLEGFENRKTPLSDHLLETMTKWKSSFIGVDPGFELMFERFETLASLASFEDNDEVTLEKQLLARPGDVFAWMPVGRVGWHSTSYESLVQELKTEAMINALLSSGFARNSRRFLELFIENFGRHAGRMSW